MEMTPECWCVGQTEQREGQQHSEFTGDSTAVFNPSCTAESPGEL